MQFRSNKDKDTVTRRELRIALNERVSGRYHKSGEDKDSITFDGFHNAAALTDAVVDAIVLDKKEVEEAMISKGPSEMAPAAITQAELEDALQDLGWGYPKAKAATFFKRVLDRRTSTYNPRVNGQEAITQAELDTAFARLYYARDVNAGNVFRDVMAHREPVWCEGQVVRDADGKIWKRQYNKQWTQLGTGQWFGDQQPERPLTPIEGS